jgi:3-carboxy-cis,cis-muconate cycloisomerase
LTAGALYQAKFALGGLIVDTARMHRNLGMTQGLIVAEAVMMGLAPHMGRQQAHDVVYDACRVVNEQMETDNKTTLAEVLCATPTVTQHLSKQAIEALCDPVNYLGLAPQMVDKAVALSKHI